MLSNVRKPPPQVTGISPKEGPPGTRVTIRGEDLGIDARDLLALRICGVDCLLSAEWKSPNKIIARTGQAKGKGEIIVATRTGGVGSSTVFFRGYHIVVSATQESAVWIDETPAFKQSTPITAEHDNPLGISDESNDKKFPEEKLLELFPEGSGNTTLENFDPQWYLLENYEKTSFDDLKAGLNYLKRKSASRGEGPKEFVKTNLTTFLDCYDTLTEMQQKLAKDESSMRDGSITLPLENILIKSNKAAVDLFYDVLARKDRADATRNALGVLQRFKFLFNLPCTMEKNIKKGDYDLVITDYTRAKSLFGDSDVKLFRQVYAEVEARSEEFREMLYNKLLELPSSVDEQKKIIRFLGHLDMPGDPAWDCLINMQKWLLEILERSKDNHVEKDHEQQVMVEPVSPSVAQRRISIAVPIRKPVKTRKSPQRILFVEELTKILMDNLPDIWRLGQAYLSGKLLKEVKNRPKLDPNKQNEFKAMILSIISLFSKLVRAAFLKATLSVDEQERYGDWADNSDDSPSAWLPICVRCIRSCVLNVSSLELPQDSVDVLQQLAFDMRANCVNRLLKQAIVDIQNMTERETWTVDTDDERGGTTLLPALFENIVSETLQHLQEVINARQSETELFAEAQIEQDAATLCIQLLQAFGSVAEKLAISGNKKPIKHLSEVVTQLYSPGPSETMPSYDKRLIVMMSNCTHTRVHIIPRLVDALEKYGYPSGPEVQASASWCYQSIDERLFDKYIEEKSNPIIGVLEHNMYEGNFDWNNCVKCTCVRTYVKEAIMGIIQVHAEVYSICPTFVPRVMYRLIEYIMDEISRLFQCIPAFCANGAVQGRLEIFALDAALGYYKTEETCAALKEALNCIPEIEDKEDENLIHELLVEFKTYYRFMLTCFQPDQRIRNSQYL